MTRARGANALLRALFETTYGTPPVSNFLQLPFVSSQLGEEQNLLQSDLLGLGREGLDPTPDVINNDGNLVVPVDARAFGYWLKLYMGDPVTSAEGSPSGDITFSAQPAVSSTITINGTAFTFVASGATGAQINIGADLATTIGNAVTVLNASSDANVTPATYSAVGGTKLHIAHDTAGLAGNAFTLACSSSPASHGTVTAATLSGGTNSHLFTSGASILPSMAVEIGMPEIPSFEMNFGIGGNTMQLGLNRSGLLNATLGLIGQGSTRAGTSAAGTPVLVTPARFAQATGEIKKDGTQLAEVVSGTLSLSNNLDKDETIRPDGRINGVDAAMFMATGNITTKVADTALLDIAGSDTPVELSQGWTKGPFSLLFSQTRVFLPKVKTPITGPNGIQASFDWQASGQSGHGLTATLVNDIASY